MEIREIEHKDTTALATLVFEIEGIKRNTLIIDGQFVDEYYMSKIL